MRDRASDEKGVRLFGGIIRRHGDVVCRFALAQVFARGVAWRGVA